MTSSAAVAAVKLFSSKPPRDRTAAALEQAGAENRRLRRRIAALEAGELIEDVADQFSVLIDLIDDCLGVKYLPLDMRLQIELVAGLLGLDRRWAS